MPNKSDSAGKLHQYFTCKQLGLKCSVECVTPLDEDTERSIHLSSFNAVETNSLKKIGALTADAIIAHSNSSIAKVEDIGVSSGALGHQNTDDLVVMLEGGETIGYSLKCAKGISQILSKNMGAKSLVKEYFQDNAKQVEFNVLMEESYLKFLNGILKTNHSIISEIKKNINEDAISKELDKARFGDNCYEHANEGRNTFLRELRNELLRILKELDKENLASAANLILDTEKNHLLADYNANRERVEFVSIPVKVAADILEIKDRGNDSVTIETADYSIGFRYKFESGITSSIKLVGDYKKLDK
jgi:hypothetical protein